MSKNRVIVEAVLAGQSHGSVARQYGISKVWVGKLVARWRAGGWNAVEKQSTRPRSNPNATSAEVIERIIALRLELPLRGLDAGPHTIAAHLERQGASAPSVATIWRILSREGLVVPEPRKRPRRSYLRFEADLPNECWQSDFTHWPLADRTDSEILSWLDDHSRLALSVTAHRVITGPIVLDTFRAAVDKHGIPASTLTDNGMVFTTRMRMGRNSFERELTILGIEQKNGRPNHPQTQGKVERFQQTLKKWLRAQTPVATLLDLQTQLDEFSDIYNHDRPHRSLNKRTPAQAYAARAKATPTGRDGHWRMRTDKVDKTGRVTVRHASRLHHIGIGYEHAGTPVRMLIHDLHITVINIDTGEIIRDLTLDTSRDYQPLGRPPGPPKGRPQQGGRKKKTPPTNTKSRDTG
jgi:transposase InsO family protein